MPDMSSALTGKQVAFLVAHEGIEQVELVEPWKAVEQALRTDADAVAFAKAFMDAGKPVAALAHGDVEDGTVLPRAR